MVFNIFSEPQIIGKTSGTPTLAVYDGKLFCVHEGAGEDGWLWCVYFDGEKWSSDTQLDFGTTGPPALAVYDNKLFCVHEGGREDGCLWYTYFDGKKWSSDTKLPNHGVGSRRKGFPSIGLAVYKDKLFCVHEGAGEDGWLWCTYFDGKTWSPDQQIGARTSGGASLVVLNDDNLWCFHEADNERGILQHTKFNGTEWSLQELTLVQARDKLLLSPMPFGNDILTGEKVYLAGAPTVCKEDKMLYTFYQGYGEDGRVHTFNNIEYSSQMTNFEISRTPSVAPFNRSIYTAAEGPGNNGELRITSAKLPPSKSEEDDECICDKEGFRNGADALKRSLYNGETLDAKTLDKAEKRLQARGYRLVGWHGTRRENAIEIINGAPRTSNPRPHEPFWNGFYAFTNVSRTSGYMEDIRSSYMVLRVYVRLCECREGDFLQVVEGDIDRNLNRNNLPENVRDGSGRYIIAGPDIPGEEGMEMVISQRLIENGDVICIPSLHEPDSSDGVQYFIKLSNDEINDTEENLKNCAQQWTIKP